ALVQVTTKPLTRQCLNTSVCEARHLNFDDSLIGAIETSLYNGPVYFDGYPDLTISLTDKNILETLKINIKLHGYNMLPGSEIIAVIHHVHYKATDSICPKSLVNLTKGETRLMKCATNDSNILIPQNIKWSDINIPEDWSIKSDTIAPSQENIENTSLHSITQIEEGLVEKNLAREKLSLSNPSKLSLSNPSKLVYQTFLHFHIKPLRGYLVNTKPLLQIFLCKKGVKTLSEIVEGSEPLPTYPDLQIEERGKFTQVSYQGGTILEWNIDGMNEYHIINKLEMTMVSNAHKIKNNSDKTVTNLLIAGFTGQLKGCNNETIEDAVSTLIYNIAKYFVRDPTYLKDGTSDQLSNLRYRKLSFRWYKDTFMTKVLTREDANQPY
ncbi:LOW QUALITY PROTEIN: MP domain-containing protein, partial [Cephalotus follicularis]